MSVPNPPPSNTSKTPPKETTQKRRHAEKRLSSRPNSLSLEMLLSSVDNLSSGMGVPPEASLTAYLAFVKNFVRYMADLLVEENAGLVGDVVHSRYFFLLKSHNVDLDDAKQEGMMGLIRAAHLFDPSLGFNFSTYAMCWVHCYIRRLIFQDASRQGPEEDNDTTSECALGHGFSKSRGVGKRGLPDRDRWPTSLPPGEGTERAAKGEVADPKGDREERRVTDKLDVKDLLGDLDPVDRRVIELRFLEGQTLERVARILLEEGILQEPITKERVRQREVNALAAVRKKVRKATF